MEQQVEFRGNAREWFGIWIVNLVLSLATFGIYSAWAKVRRKKYFYNNTYIAGRNFDYHATGKQILIGRLIVGAGFIVFSLLSAIPILNIILYVVLLAIVPWLIVRGMIFNARMSSWSNVRFGFAESYKQAYKVYLLYPILTFLTLYTTFPMLDRAMKRFNIENHRLGSAKFEFNAPLGPFYKAALGAIVWVLLVGGVAGAMAFSSLSGAGFNPDDPTTIALLIGAFYGVFFLGFIPAIFIYQAMTRNVIYNTTELEGGHKFRSSVKPTKLFWIAVSNVVVVACTLGLMMPWAQIRMARYLAAQTGLIAGPSLDEFVGVLQKQSSAMGDAYADLDGFEVGLPM